MVLTSSVPRLKDLCTNVIIKHFDKLMNALESNTVPKKPYEYLQRVQSVTLFKKLSRKKKYCKYVKFLLNPFIKNINLKPCVWDCDAVAKQLATVAETVESLAVSGRYFHSKHIADLAHGMTNLQSLSLSSIHMAKPTLQTIGKYCTSLRILNISFSTFVTDDEIKALCAIEDEKASDRNFKKNYTLQQLDIRKTFVTAVGVAFILEHFPNIEFIRHYSVFDALCNIHADYLEKNDRSNLKIYNLKKLIISNKEQYFHIPSLKLCRSLCPYISELSVGYISSQSELDVIKEFPALTKACLISPIDIYFDLSSFLQAGGSNLELLVLKDSTISVQVLLKSCPNLTRLRLDDIHFKSIEEKDVIERDTLPHLTEFGIECLDFTADNVLSSISIILSAVPNLEKLTFLSVDALALDFVDSIVTHDCLENIQELNIINSDIEAAAARKFLTICPNIRKFNLKDTPMRYQDYKSLKCIRPGLKIITDYSLFVFDSEDDEDSASEHSWMNDHDDEIFIFSNGSASEDSEFEPPSTDAEDEDISSLDLDDEEEEIYRPSIDDILGHHIQLAEDIWTDEEDLEYEPSSSDDDEDESSDTSDEESIHTDEEKDLSSAGEVDHESSDDEEPKRKRRCCYIRLNTDSIFRL